MPFNAINLSDKVIEKLNKFLGEQDFVELYSTYNWKNDTLKNGFPDIFCLESRFKYSEKTTGITISDVKTVAEWGRLRAPNRIKRKEIVLPVHTMRCKNEAINQNLKEKPLMPLTILQENITQGIGRTYSSKILRFALPQEYGAIDTRIVRVFGRDGFKWFELYANTAIQPLNRWPSEYGTWINILRYFASKLLEKKHQCPHPQRFVNEGLRTKGKWECADVEMALFSYASQQLNKGEKK